MGESHDSLHLHLVEIKYLPPTTATYITLSHCWGFLKIISLCKDTYASFLEAIQLGMLSQTFRDTAELVRLLGYRYLWIDSLCILQDSPEDWAYESSRMGEVYSQAILNIAATASSNGDGGLSRREIALSEQPCLI